MALEKRKHLDRMLYFQFTKGALESLLVLLCFVGILLMGGVWILQSYFNDLASQLTVISNQQTQKNATMKQINHTLHSVESIQKQHTVWIPFIADIANVTPSGVVIQNAQLNHAQGEYTLSGIAKTREDLLTFQQNLEGIPYMQEVQVPLSQLIEKEDIRFAITVVLDLKKL